MKADQYVIIEVIYPGHLSSDLAVPRKEAGVQGNATWHKLQAARKLGTRGTLYLAPC